VNKETGDRISRFTAGVGVPPFVGGDHFCGMGRGF